MPRTRRRRSLRIIADPTVPRPAPGSGLTPILVPQIQLITHSPAVSAQILAQPEKIQDNTPFRLPGSIWKEEGVDFSKFGTLNACCLFSALMCKLAYISDAGVLNSVKSMVGATGGARVTQTGEEIPNGHYIEWDKFVLVAIQGTTQNGQLKQYVEHANVSTGFVAGAGHPEANGLAYSDISNPSFPAKWMGWYFPPFVTYATPWIDWIRTKQSDWAGKKIWLTGHSLGAAVCEVIANYFSAYYPTPTTTEALASNEPNPLDANRWCGGYNFGSPKLCVVSPFADFRARTSTFNAARIFSVHHPYDPVQHVPIWSRLAPWRVRMFGYTQAFPLRNYTKPSRFLNDIKLRSRNGGELDRMPQSIEGIKDFIGRYHGIDRYLDLIRGHLEKDEGEMNEDWAALWNVIRAHASDEVLV